jgi:hypothetical protein
MSKIEKLELRHLAGYLPYGLKFLHDEEKTPYTLVNLGEEHKKNPLPVDGIKGEVLASFYLEGITPLLRNLSDLTKEIEHNGERFVPKDKLFLGDKSFVSFKRSISKNAIHCEPYWIIQKLFEWHFDVFGLIDSGLSVDLNTVKL